ncbi:MAG TPA: short chain dehydrogenase [Candidatus Kryptonia bacterium]
MKIILVGATGLIGSEILKSLSPRHDVIIVSHARDSDLQVDIGSKSSIEAMIKKVGRFDALVSAAGNAAFGKFEKLNDEDFHLGLMNKLMGQVNLVRLGVSHINDNGSFTLTAGTLSRHPIPGSAAISIVNAGLEGFVRAAALELKHGVRINVVSPPFATETLKKLDMDTSTGIPVAKFAAAYVESVEGKKNGEVIEIE